MTIASIAASEDLHQGYQLWPRIRGRAAGSGLTAGQAIAAASRSPDGMNHDHDRGGGHPDREAAD